MTRTKTTPTPQTSSDRAAADRAWHAEPVAAVAAVQDSPAEGLTGREAAARLARFGPNALPREKRRGPLSRLLGQFNNVLIYVLLASAALTALMAHWIDTGVILAVVAINAAIGFVQEGRAEAALGAIRAMLAPAATVRRDGRWQRLDAAELVPGDRVRLESGDLVAADLRLADTRALTIAEAALTGESVPVAKTVDPVAAEAYLGERTGMAYSGTQVVAGRGEGIVVATGRGTELGRIGGMVALAGSGETPLVRLLDQFARRLSLVIVGIGLAVFAIGWLLRGYALEEMFLALVGLLVSAIPEGLPAVVTITLAIGVERMARRKAIVRRLPVVETLGAVNTICTDKTGTLTENRMVVAAIGIGGEILAGDALDRARDARHAWLAQIGVLCNEAAIAGATADNPVGDPTETALIAFAHRVGIEAGIAAGTGAGIGAGIGADIAVGDAERLDLLPFESERGYMAALYRQPDDSVLVVVKGAPERLFTLTDLEWRPDGAVPADLGAWHRMVERMAAGGQRVLAAAMATLPRGSDSLDGIDMGELALVGLFGLIDPPRPEVRAAIADCHAAGIDVKMITGDHPVTARAIAEALGLPSSSVLTGRDIDALDDAALAARVGEVDIVARATPENKLRLVEAIAGAGKVVAMTGDGVNDAPALRRADVGIAMGKRGTDAARHAAEIVLADDNFATIAAAVREGRTIYDNLKKTIVFLLPTNGGEALTIVTAILVGMALPIAPLQILWINMITAVTLGLALAFEPAEPDIMRRPPRPRGARLLDARMAWIAGFASVVMLAGALAGFLLGQAFGGDVAAARTIAVNALVGLETTFLFSVRYADRGAISLPGLRGTPAVWIALAIVCLGQLAFTYLPVFHLLFGSTALDVPQLALSLAIAAAGFFIYEGEKQVRLAWRRRGRKRG